MAYAHLKGNVMQYFKPGEQMRMMYYSVVPQANTEKEVLSESVPFRYEFSRLELGLSKGTEFSGCSDFLLNCTIVRNKIYMPRPGSLSYTMNLNTLDCKTLSPKTMNHKR